MQARSRIAPLVGISLVALVALAMFTWPLFISAAAAKETAMGQAMFVVAMPLLLILVFVELSSGHLDSRQLAILAVLLAVNSVVRLLGAGFSGIETIFFLIVIAGGVFGPSFGFLVGSGSLLVSALIGAGIGPWLPFQMMAAGLVGLLAGLVPRPKGRWARTGILAAYSVPAAYLYGALMTMWNWPFLAGADSSIGYAAGAPLFSNLRRFFEYELVTGGLMWDTGRAITTCALVLVTAPTLIATLERAVTRAGVKRF